MDGVGGGPSAAIVQIPHWLWGGNPKKFFSAAKLYGRPIDAKSHLWRVQTFESWQKSRPSLVTVSHVAGPTLASPRFEALQQMASNETPVRDPDDSIVVEINRLGERAEKTESPADAFAYFQLKTVAIQSDALTEAVREVYENLLQVGLTSDPGAKVFANAGVHVFQRDAALIHRLKMASVWLRVVTDEKLGLGDISQIQAALAAGDTAFSSSEGLYEGIYTLDAYLGPLLGSLSPAVWAFHASRMLGTIIFTLGQPISGTTGTAAELLHLLPHQGNYESSEIPELSAGAPTEAVNWWAWAINELFAILGDLAIFTDRAGSYAPAKHLQALLTVEQLFRRVNAIQTLYRDASARRTLLFTVLDTLERLTGRDLAALCALPFAQKAFDGLADRIPPAAAEVLLPSARRGLAALEDLQKGFFIRRHVGAADVEWTDPSAGPVKLSPAEAAAEYIKLLRNSTHGHGSNRSSQVVKTVNLLTHHNGRVPHDLALLGYLYLLDLLSRPSDLRRSLYQGGRT